MADLISSPGGALHLRDAQYKDLGNGAHANDTVGAFTLLWDTTTLTPVRALADHATGALQVYIAGGSGGGGGAATIADGADVAQGSTTDAAVGDASGTLNAHLRQIAKVVTAGVTFASPQHVIVDTAPTTAVTGTFFQATQPVSLATAPTTPVTGTFWQATQPISGAISLAANQTVAVTNAGTFAVQATLAAETTKVIGTVNQGTSPWVTSRNWTLGSGTDSVAISNTSFAATQGTSPWIVTDATGTAADASGTLPALVNVIGGYDGTNIRVATVRQHRGYQNLYVRDDALHDTLTDVLLELRTLNERLAA